MSLVWQFYPRSEKAPHRIAEIAAVFTAHHEEISSAKFDLNSNDVLAVVHDDLAQMGIEVESGKTKDQKIPRPVRFSRNGAAEKSFEVDGWDPQSSTIIEVEAGRGVVNNQWLKDLFEAFVIPDAKYLVIAVRAEYKGGKDFESVATMLETLYGSRLQIPLSGILLVGY
jgi:hypothetical protein